MNLTHWPWFLNAKSAQPPFLHSSLFKGLTWPGGGGDWNFITSPPLATNSAFSAVGEKANARAVVQVEALSEQASRGWPPLHLFSTQKVCPTDCANPGKATQSSTNTVLMRYRKRRRGAVYNQLGAYRGRECRQSLDDRVSGFWLCERRESASVEERWSRHPFVENDGSHPH